MEIIMSRLCSRWLVLGAVLFLQACNINAFRTGGNSEKGYFQVAPTGSLAVDGWLTYTVRDWEFLGAAVSGINFKLVSASNDAAAHIRTMTPAADLTVDGLAPGQSRIAFNAVADGDSIDDAFTIDVQAVTHLGIGGCSQGGVYVRGTNGKVVYAFLNAATAPIKGLGLYPFTVEPASGATFLPDLSTTEAWTFAIPPTAPNLVRVVSTLAGDYADYTMTIIDKSDIDGVVPTTASSNTHYGKSITVGAAPVSQGRPICAQIRQIVTSSTPAICKPIKDGFDVSSVELLDDSVQVDFIAAGTCILTLVLPDLGVTVAWPPWTLTTLEPPSSGGGHDDDD
jgi:hypothetical protein